MNGRSAMLLSLAAVLLVVQQTHGAIDFEIFDTTFGNTGASLFSLRFG